METWYGMLTISNVEEIANKINELLVGKQYTFVSVNMYGNVDVPGELISRPEVRTSQYLKSESGRNSLNVWRDKDNDTPKFAGFNFGDSYGVWGCSTNTDSPHYDHTYNNPYIVLEYDKVRITHRAPAGHLLYWVIAIENK